MTINLHQSLLLTTSYGTLRLKRVRFTTTLYPRFNNKTFSTISVLKIKLLLQKISASQQRNHN